MHLAVRLILGLAVALVVPRLRPVLLLAFSLLLAAAGFGALVLRAPISIAGAAAVAGVGLAAAILLPRLLPRLFLYFLLLAGVLLPLARLRPEGTGARVLLWAGMAAVAFLLALLVRRYPRGILRIAGAVLGAAIAVAGTGHPVLFGAALALVLVLADAILRSRQDADGDDAPSHRLATSIALGLGAAAAALVLALPRLALELPPPPPASALAAGLPPLPFDARREAVRSAATAGGLVWPLLSETVAWGEPGLDRRLYPILDNLDAFFLGGSRTGLQKLPGTGLSGRFSLRPELARARRTADPAALARLRAAAKATVGALDDVLPLVRAGAKQADVGAALLRAMTARGCGPESFPPIASSGEAAAAPHGDGNQGLFGAGELVVMDFGCSVDQYASDYTRTFPVDGRFTPRQRALYDAVFAAQAAALAACKPGVRLGGRGKGEGGESLDAIARKVLRERAPDHDEHMPHGLGHTVGLFVHDVMLDGPLQEGDVVTIEPGTYLEGELGIRIEDTVLVTATGCEPITQGFPADADAVEAAMAKVAGVGKGRP